MVSNTEQLATFIVTTEFQSIPRELVSLAKKATLDFCGVALAGSKLEQSADLISDYVKEM